MLRMSSFANSNREKQMFSSLNFWLMSIVLVGIFVLWRFYLPWRKSVKQRMEQVATCGYLAPPPSPRAVRFLLQFARVLAFIQVGKINIVGRENLDGVKGPIMVTPNHPHWADTIVVPLMLKGPMRMMMARGAFQFCFGWLGMLVSWVGAFSADLTPGKGGPARDAAIQVLKTRQTLVLFPEGWAYLDGVMGEFKKGAVRIARLASQELGQDVFLAPVFLRYGKYPGSWIRKLPPSVEYALVFFLAFLFRGGLTIVVGKPVPVSSLSADDAVATAQLRELVVALDPLTEPRSLVAV